VKTPGYGASSNSKTTICVSAQGSAAGEAHSRLGSLPGFCGRARILSDRFSSSRRRSHAASRPDDTNGLPFVEVRPTEAQVCESSDRYTRRQKTQAWAHGYRLFLRSGQPIPGRL
jgi:hypothetical protein